MNKFVLAAAVCAAMIASPATVAFAQTAAPIIVTGKYQKDFEKGSKLEAEGLADLESAQRDLVKFSADVVDAQNKRNSSQSRGTNAENEFRRLTSGVTNFTDPEDALDWAKKVRSAAEDWERFDDRGSDGQNSLEKATKKQRSAREDVEKAEGKVAKGRAMMAEARRRSQGGS